LETICEIYVKQLNGRLLDQNISISLDREAMKWVIAKDSENKCDARSLRSNFEKYVEDPLAKEILGSAFSPGKYTLRGDGDGLRISFQEKGVGVDGELRTSPLKVHSQMGIPIE
jgi:ATP-dependent Clp protease ATP-binding subunit ClpA